LKSMLSVKPCGNSAWGALEATALLRTVMEEIDLAIFTFDNCKKTATGQSRPANACWAVLKNAYWDLPRKNWDSALAWRAKPAHTMELALSRKLRALGAPSWDLSPGRLASSLGGSERSEVVRSVTKSAKRGNG